jgi:tetratricopeptide (TPR) repeat protein
VVSYAPPTADEWTRRGLRLYRLLVQLPARNSTWFRDLPSREETRGYLEDGLRLADERGMRDTLEGAALLTAKSFFWWTWPEGRDEADLLDALRTAREAVRITEALAAPRRASEALDALGNMLASTGDLRGQLESHTRRLFWARQIEDTGELVDIHSEVSAAFQMVGEYALAVEHARTALDYAETEDADVLRIQALQREALAHFEWDRWQEAIAAGERVLALAAHTSLAAHSTIESTHRHRAVLLTLATLYARTGRGGDAEQVVRLVSDVSSAHEAQLVGVQRARVALAQGAIPEAKKRFLAALEYRTGRPLVATLVAELAELGARTEDRALYERFGEQALELGWRSGARKALAQAIRARGLAAAGRWDDGIADLENALDRYHALGTAWEEARTRVDIAALARHRGAPGDIAVARGQLERALRAFEDLGAESDLAAARAALAALAEGEVQRV